MCLAIVAIDALPDWPLVIVANRDEFHAREASEAAPWHDAPDVVAGRDLQAGGTWLGVTRQGRAALSCQGAAHAGRPLAVRPVILNPNLCRGHGAV